MRATPAFSGLTKAYLEACTTSMPELFLLKKFIVFSRSEFLHKKHRHKYVTGF